ncbi:DUF6951 family protein [Chloroflexota bacterium]
MKIEAQIAPGICNFNTVVTAETEDSKNVTFEFVSECKIIKEFERHIQEISPVNALKTLGPKENPVMLKARELLQTKGCCEACVVPIGTVKIMYVATKLALPKDVSLTITIE